MLLAVLLSFSGVAAVPAAASPGAERVKAVATFSILGDMVRQVGGDRVEVTTFVGPDGNAHDLEPAPADAKRLAQSDVLFLNGLGLEGWLPRLEQASGFAGETVILTKGIEAAAVPEKQGTRRHRGGGERGDGAGHQGDAAVDPHAWQSPRAAKVYVENIRDGLIAADPAGKAGYEANARAYLKKIDALDREIRAAVARIPDARRVVITSHDAFGYFGREYGISFLAPQGVAAESEASAKTVARIIDQVRERQVPAVFLENVSDPRLLTQIAKETGATIGGTLYSDALSAPEGPAPTYLDMIRHNLRELAKALQPES